MAEYTSRTLKEAMQKDKDRFVLKRSELKSQVWESLLGLLFLRWDGDLKEVSAETSQVGAAGDSPKCPTE